jgi:hypothetical protein
LFVVYEQTGSAWLLCHHRAGPGARPETELHLQAISIFDGLLVVLLFGPLRPEQNVLTSAIQNILDYGMQKILFLKI